MTRKIRLTESELHDIIQESVINYLVENEEEEGFFGNAKNAIVGGWNAGRKAGYGNFWNSAVDGGKNTYNSSFVADTMDKASKMAQQLIKTGVDPNVTLAQVAQGQGKGSGKYGMARGRATQVLNANKKGYTPINQWKR